MNVLSNFSLLAALLVKSLIFPLFLIAYVADLLVRMQVRVKIVRAEKFPARSCRDFKWRRA